MSTILTEKRRFAKFKFSTFPANNRRFLRFQLTAVMATIVDFSMTIFTKNIFHVHYTIAVATGAISGAITAFLINRYWVFSATKNDPVKQALRYTAVVLGSILLNTAGTFALTELMMLTYLISKAVVALIVGFTYSYYFSKRFVFYA
ncbi:MAG TPA: GtrA family protein [Bacteroidia bacterium]|nr:GtrA family protein [Bacteroidota bacterium]HQV99739.1 GtrA family protein [Bacteroidia bacterium]HQW22161.1 GtrA family protein [Bacteroidia bacterium]